MNITKFSAIVFLSISGLNFYVSGRKFRENGEDTPQEFDGKNVGGRRQKRGTINDASWSQQWQLQTSLTPSMGVYEAWDLGYTGKGIVIGIVDSGTDPDHVDLVDNYDAGHSYDYVNDDANAEVDVGYPGYGVECAGLAVAQNNTDCIIGVAHDSTFVAIKILSGGVPADSIVAQALNHSRDYIDIYSNSWGPADDGLSIDDNDDIGPEASRALYDGITMGRGGKGSIYVFSSGEGGAVYDDCNLNGYVASPYTIAIGSVDAYGNHGDNGEPCASILAVTYGGNSDQPVTTTAAGDQCSGTFYGAHAATPIASGIIAMMLEANNNLTWRDVQHLIVAHAQPVDNSNYITNGAGKMVSVDHGFGLMNAKAMVTAAPLWNTVSEQILCTGSLELPNVYHPGLGTITNATEVDVNSCNITSLEHVTVFVEASFYYREYSEIWLLSPMGTYSRLLRNRKNDTDYTPIEWYFTSVHFWGENPNGIWQIEVRSTASFNEMLLMEWQLYLRGMEVPVNPSTLPESPVDPDSDQEDEMWDEITIGTLAGAAAVGVVVVIGILIIKGGKAASTVAIGNTAMMGNQAIDQTAIQNTRFKSPNSVTSVSVVQIQD